MYKISLLSALFCVASTQLASWPASSYSPYYQALFGPARTPVNSVPVFGQGVAPSAIPAPPQVAVPVFAAPALPVAAPIPFAAPALPVPAPLPFAAPLSVAAPVAVPAAPILRGPAFAYAPSPVLAPIRPAVVAAAPIAPIAPVAPVVAAPAISVIPRFVPAYAPFATSAVFIGSNKGKKTA